MAKRLDEIEKTGKIQCLFLDLDGTVLHTDKSLSEETLQELLRVQAQGIHLVIATGRLIATVPKFPDCLHFDYYITSNGAAIYDHAGNLVFSRNMSAETTLAILEQHTEDDYPEYFIDGRIHVNQWQIDQMKDYQIPPTNQKNVREGAVRHENMRNYFMESQKTCEKVCTFFKAPCDDAKMRALKERCSRIPGIHSVSGGSLNLEFTDIEVSKAKAVAFVLKRLGLSMDEAAAFGDSENDLDLFVAVTYGIAVENACAELKEQAWAIVPSNNEDGVAKAIKKLI